MATNARIVESVRRLRDAGVPVDQADAIGVAAAEVAEAAADRIADRVTIRLGAWTLAVVALASAVIIAAIG